MKVYILFGISYKYIGIVKNRIVTMYAFGWVRYMERLPLLQMPAERKLAMVLVKSWNAAGLMVVGFAPILVGRVGG